MQRAIFTLRMGLRTTAYGPFNNHLPKRRQLAIFSSPYGLVNISSFIFFIRVNKYRSPERLVRLDLWDKQHQKSGFFRPKPNTRVMSTSGNGEKAMPQRVSSLQDFEWQRALHARGSWGVLSAIVDRKRLGMRWHKVGAES